jgi:hypothetical protein
MFLRSLVLALVLLVGGCGVIQPIMSVGSGYITHERFQALRPIIERMEARITTLEGRLNALR